jgi:hypothetical protein
MPPRHINRSHPRSESETVGHKGYGRGALLIAMKLREWTAAAVGSEKGPPAADEWVSVEGPESPARFAGECAVAYRTTFAAPCAGRALLSLRGLYAHARVWLNDELLGSHDTYFTPFRTVFDPAEENELLVECRAPEDRFGGVFQTPLVWPAASVPGIRWSASVESVPEIAITDLTVRPDETDESGVNAIVTIDAGTDFTGRIRLSLHPAGADGASALSQVGVSADAGERVTVQGRLSVRDPDRWWPRGFGPQHRYTVRATLGESERTATTGFQTVEYDSDGLSVNGTRIPVRGVVSLPAGRRSAAETVERAVGANATLIRCHGYAPPNALYDAASEAGVLVCQDVPLSPGALDAERARLVARRLAGEYGHHPSLAAFGIHDDAYAFDATTDEGGRRVLRATGEGDRAATAAAAAAALPDTVPVFPMTGLGAGHDEKVSKSWVLDGYAGADRSFDAGTHTRYVVAGTDSETAERAGRAIEALRRSGRPLVMAFVPPRAEAATEAIGAAFEPVGVSLDDLTAAEPDVVVVNDIPESVAGELEWSAAGKSGTLPVEVEPLSREALGEISVPPDAPRVELSLSAAGRTVTNTYER